MTEDFEFLTIKPWDEGPFDKLEPWMIGRLVEIRTEYRPGYGLDWIPWHTRSGRITAYGAAQVRFDDGEKFDLVVTGNAVYRSRYVIDVVPMMHDTKLVREAIENRGLFKAVVSPAANPQAIYVIGTTRYGKSNYNNHQARAVRRLAGK